MAAAVGKRLSGTAAVARAAISNNGRAQAASDPTAAGVRRCVPLFFACPSTGSLPVSDPRSIAPTLKMSARWSAGAPERTSGARVSKLLVPVTQLVQRAEPGQHVQQDPHEDAQRGGRLSLGRRLPQLRETLAVHIVARDADFVALYDDATGTNEVFVFQCRSCLGFTEAFGSLLVGQPDARHPLDDDETRAVIRRSNSLDIDRHVTSAQPAHN